MTNTRKKRFQNPVHRIKLKLILKIIEKTSNKNN
jgi:hypothetical protein